jgi:hypothetical protein
MPFAVAALLLLINQLETPETITDPVAIAATAAEMRTSLEAMARDPVQRLGLPLQLELERIVSVRTAALLRDVSVDTIKKYFKQYLVKTGDGDKMIGIRLKHALSLAEESISLPPSRAKRKPPQARKRRVGQGAKSVTPPSAMPEAP